MSLWIGAGNARAEVLTTPVAGPLMLEVDGEVQKVGFPAGDGRGLYFQADDVKEIFGISVLDYPDGTVIPRTLFHSNHTGFVYARHR